MSKNEDNKVNYYHKIIKEVDVMLKDKKIIAIGDRDGIPGPAIEAVAKSAGGDVVFASTECFV